MQTLVSVSLATIVSISGPAALPIKVFLPLAPGSRTLEFESRIHIRRVLGGCIWLERLIRFSSA